MTFPLRTRITALYFAVLVVSFLSFAWISDFAFRNSIETTVNDAAKSNLDSVRGVLLRVSSKRSSEVEDELNNLSGLWAGAGLLQVTNEKGVTIFQSKPFANPDRSLPIAPATKILFSTANLDAVQYRIVTTSVRTEAATFHVRAAVPTEPFDQAQDRFRLLLQRTLPVLIVLATILGYWLSGRALRPIKEIIATARGIGVRSLSVRLPAPKSRDELRLLTETLNQMLERIESSVKRIRQFTADASHDLRTPLAVIRSTAELALRRPRTDAQYRKALERNLTTSVETSYLIENLLMLARADSGAAGLEFRKIDLLPRLQKAVEETAILAACKNIRIDSTIRSSPMMVSADGVALDRVFRIVLENAVKYTPSGGQIGVVGRSNGRNSAEVEVRDTGIGIEEKDLPHIFERFYRADGARSRETGGSGLGLAIARTFMDMHGGTIEALSSPGAGSVFVIRLPFSANPKSL
jgi:heavy metal sensor kinase